MSFRVVLPTMGWTVLHQLTINQSSIGKPIGQSDLTNTVIETPSQVTVGYVKMTVKANGNKRKGSNFPTNLYALLSEPMGSFSYGVTVSETWCDTFTLFGNPATDPGLIKGTESAIQGLH